MIKSKVLIKTGLMKLLEDPKAITTALAKLEAQEKKAKAATKAMYDGKTKAAFVTALEKKAQELQAVCAEAEAGYAEALHKKKTEVQILDAEMSAFKKETTAKLKSATEKEAKARNILLNAERTDAFVEDIHAEAIAVRNKYDDLRQEYEDKLGKLKDSLNGIV